MAKISNIDIVKKSTGIKNFPKVLVDQTNLHISDIIKRNLAGQQILGETHLSYDYDSTDQMYDPEKVNPFSGLSFDLDDLIIHAERNGQTISDLQNRLGEINAALIAKQKEAAAPGTDPAQTQTQPKD